MKASCLPHNLFYEKFMQGESSKSKATSMVIKTWTIPRDLGAELPEDLLGNFQTHSVVTSNFSDFHDRLLHGNDNLIQYNTYAASILMYISAWCYSNQEDFTGMMARAGIKGVDCVEVSRWNDAMFISATAEVIRSDDGRLAIVCFRGTELTNPISWLTDVSATPKKVYNDEIQVHGGFVRNFQSIWPEVVQALCCEIDEGEHEHEHRNLKFCRDEGRLNRLEALYICGHSLGGAMASLAALSLYYVNDEKMRTLRQKLRGVYTYGQPMLVSGKNDHNYVPALDMYAEHSVFRHVFEKDPVPHLPPVETGRWCHVGLELRLKDGVWVPHARDDYSAQAKTWKIAAGAAVFLTDQLDPIHAMRKVAELSNYNFGHHSPWSYIDKLPPNPVVAEGLRARLRRAWGALMGENPQDRENEDREEEE